MSKKGTAEDKWGYDLGFAERPMVMAPTGTEDNVYYRTTIVYVNREKNTVKLRWPEDVNFGESVFKLSLNDERIWRYTCKIDFWEKLKPVGRGSNSKKNRCLFPGGWRPKKEAKRFPYNPLPISQQRPAMKGALPAIKHSSQNHKQQQQQQQHHRASSNSAGSGRGKLRGMARVEAMLAAARRRKEEAAAQSWRCSGRSSVSGSGNDDDEEEEEEDGGGSSGSGGCEHEGGSAAALAAAVAAGGNSSTRNAASGAPDMLPAQQQQQQQPLGVAEDAPAAVHPSPPAAEAGVVRDKQTASVQQRCGKSSPGSKRAGTPLEGIAAAAAAGGDGDATDDGAASNSTKRLRLEAAATPPVQQAATQQDGQLVCTLKQQQQQQPKEASEGLVSYAPGKVALAAEAAAAVSPSTADMIMVDSSNEEVQQTQEQRRQRRWRRQHTQEAAGTAVGDDKVSAFSEMWSSKEFSKSPAPQHTTLPPVDQPTGHDNKQQQQHTLLARSEQGCKRVVSVHIAAAVPAAAAAARVKVPTDAGRQPARQLAGAGGGVYDSIDLTGEDPEVEGGLPAAAAGAAGAHGGISIDLTGD